MTETVTNLLQEKSECCLQLAGDTEGPQFESAYRSGCMSNKMNLPFAPDLAVEVVSPYDSFASVEEKALSWLNAGTKLVLIAVPQSRSVHAYRSKTEMSIYGEGEFIEADDVVPG
jgi:Uma2 family endonuclease